MRREKKAKRKKEEPVAGYRRIRGRHADAQRGAEPSTDQPTGGPGLEEERWNPSLLLSCPGWHRPAGTARRAATGGATSVPWGVAAAVPRGRQTAAALPAGLPRARG